ncbi:long-chain-fatty-acid--protein ligase [Neolewinella persica]|uniref:hypothetical protein n=1 Tax=Neolewinella persica TaxID=70998 RepID=UPI00036634F6|nr:hypothetical protein [Neolewinella persica]
MKRGELPERIRAVSPATFPTIALDVFQYQAKHNLIYAQFLELLRVDPVSVRRMEDIPYLPIALFKRYTLRSGEWEPVRTFSSSGTTGSTTSRHPLRNEEWYRTNAREAFNTQYGPLKDRPVLALLPAYLERTGSSLVFMADDFIRQSGHELSGFFLDDLTALQKRLTWIQAHHEGPAPLLIGVSFALLDLAESYPGDLSKFIIMETGGMKGRRREMTREELHGTLSEAFNVKNIHSEYGMTELLSQAYAPEAGLFYPAPTLRATTREITDPLTATAPGKTGALNLIDLANLNTISFIATDDLGRVNADGTFEVLGRMDASDVRGCNLLVHSL